MIFYKTDNSISEEVSKSFLKAGFDVRHIKDFNDREPAVFYGYLRGCGMAMRFLERNGVDYYYMDNGYFGAEYVDRKFNKTLGGFFRIVKNGMIERFNKVVYKQGTISGQNFLVLPPTEYFAFMNDTTPGDWLMKWCNILRNRNCGVVIRKKDCNVSLDEQLRSVDSVLSFNSMAVVRAVEMGRAVYDTNGIFRNADMILNQKIPVQNIGDLFSFYADKQYTLYQIENGGLEWIKEKYLLDSMEEKKSPTMCANIQ